MAFCLAEIQLQTRAERAEREDQEARGELYARIEMEAREARDFMARQETLVREKAAAALVYEERKAIINELFAIVSDIDFAWRQGGAIDADPTPLPARFPRIQEISRALEDAGFEYIGLKSLAEDGRFWLGLPMIYFPEEDFRARLFIFTLTGGVSIDISDPDVVEDYKIPINESSAIIPLDPLDEVWWVGYIVYPPAMLEEAGRLKEMYEENKTLLLNLLDALGEVFLTFRMSDRGNFYGGGQRTDKAFSAADQIEIEKNIQALIKLGLCRMEFVARVGTWYDSSENTRTYKAIKERSGAQIILCHMEEGNGLYDYFFVPIECLDEGWMIGFIFGSGVPPGGT
jgi:hypothetical protein